MNMATYKITAELNLEKIIAESREVAQALNEFADNLERIERKYAEPQESEAQDADDADTETWNGYHGQVTAPKGTFKRIYADADGGDAE